MTIRRCEKKDLEEILDIYNDAVRNTTISFDIKERAMEAQVRWFEEHGEHYPIYILEENSEVLAWLSLSRWSGRCAYKNTVELSVYVKKGHRGKGIGKKICDYSLEEAKKLEIHTIISLITEENEISINLHKKYGFETVGVLKEVGKKFDQLLNVIIMQKIL